MKKVIFFFFFSLIGSPCFGQLGGGSGGVGEQWDNWIDVAHTGHVPNKSSASADYNVWANDPMVPFTTVRLGSSSDGNITHGPDISIAYPNSKSGSMSNSVPNTGYVNAFHALFNFHYPPGGLPPAINTLDQVLLTAMPDADKLASIDKAITRPTGEEASWDVKIRAVCGLGPDAWNWWDAQIQIKDITGWKNVETSVSIGIGSTIAFTAVESDWGGPLETELATGRNYFRVRVKLSDGILFGEHTGEGRAYVD